MIIYHHIDEVNLERPVITIGFFDGVHLGHSAIINTVTNSAKANNRNCLLITFWPHPRMVLHNDPERLKLLSSLSEKQQLAYENGIDGMLVMDFTLELAATSAIQFIENFLVKKLNASIIILGYNHSFGHKGQGNFNLLKQHEDNFNYHAIQVEPVSINGVDVSSTKIREALLTGDLSSANSMLGRPYNLSGTIEGGQQIGRSLGFPTANIKPNDPSKLVPGNGVYAVWVDYQGVSYPAMLNIGIRPTLGDGLERTIEAHIIGFDKVIYNEMINIKFAEKIREEQKFASLDALKNQLALDKNAALKRLVP
ncbi:MAG: bifunctional riboflavin kinase/FAD synthetase [Tenuifilaceae bacterium]|nr:bifunctional riboflavin kinase/FAD synthetase [Tenuifilaceae bacterium]